MSLISFLLCSSTYSEGDECLSDALTDGVDLIGVASTLDMNVHVNVDETMLSKEEDGLVGLEP